MQRRKFLLICLLALGGCASGVWYLPSYDDLPPEKSGVVIASVGGEWPMNARFSVGFRPIPATNTIGEFVFLRNSLFSRIPIDIQNGATYATVATHRLPPGKYEIYGATVMVGLGAAQLYYTDERPFSFPFEIQAGKATYLGEFLAHPVQSGSNTRAVYTVKNMQSRDLELLRKRGLEFQPDTVINAVMDKKQSSNSIFRRMDDGAL